MNNMKKQKNNIVGITEERQAIDFTPVIYITITSNIRKGQVIVWDKSECVVRLSKPLKSN